MTEVLALQQLAFEDDEESEDRMFPCFSIYESTITQSDF